MCNPLKYRACIASAMGIMLMCTLSGIAPVRALTTEGDDARIVLAGCSQYGPYATANTAMQYANYARSQGYSANFYHNGDAYYVTVC